MLILSSFLLSIFELESITENLISFEGFDDKNREKIKQRLNIFYEVGLFQSNHYIGEHYDALMYCLGDKYREVVKNGL